MATTLMIHCQRVELHRKHLTNGNSVGLLITASDGGCPMDITFFCADRANAEALIEGLPKASDFKDWDDEPAEEAA